MTKQELAKLTTLQRIERISNARIMFGYGSQQHRAAVKLYTPESPMPEPASK